MRIWNAVKVYNDDNVLRMGGPEVHRRQHSTSLTSNIMHKYKVNNKKSIYGHNYDDYVHIRKTASS